MRTTQLYEYHKRNARLTQFAGFEMPLWYKGIAEEHMAVRERAGLFDVSHMGRLWIRGREASKFLEWLLPTKLGGLPLGRAFYSLLCNEAGGVLDDLIGVKLGEEEFLLVVNAANREKDLAWIRGKAAGFDAIVEDVSDATALLALQGPKAPIILQPLVDVELKEMKRFQGRRVRLAGSEAIVTRTGYTGEDGFEMVVLDCPLEAPQKALNLWDAVLKEGEGQGLLPCGLGARDTLRLEAGLCLFGHELREDLTPLEADLEWVISWEKEFLGKKSLLERKAKGIEMIRACLVMEGRGIPRIDYPIIKDGEEVGKVSSGTYSPLLKKGIAMAFLPPKLRRKGERVGVKIREGTVEAATIVEPPFYDTQLYGWRRKSH